MDCLEFRRHLAADPRSLEPGFLAHRDSCRAGCAECWRRAQRFEHRVRNALQSIDAPDDLAERVLLAQATSLRGRSRRGWQVGIALAASLLLVLVMAGYAWNLRDNANGGTLAGMAIAHVGKEAYSLTMTKPVERQTMQPVFTHWGLTMRSAPAHAVFAADCRVGPYDAVHLVLHEAGTTITALYLVDHHITQTHDFVRAGWHGREVPMGSGTLILLGVGTSGFTAAERAVAAAVLGRA